MISKAGVEAKKPEEMTVTRMVEIISLKSRVWPLIWTVEGDYFPMGMNH
jgi:hypothetical protein